MSQLKLLRVVGAIVILAGIPFGAVAQTQAPIPPSPTPPPARFEPGPTPPSTVQPDTTGKFANPPGEANSLIRMAVFSSDGSKVGTVQSVSMGPGGSVKSIQIRTGGFLGFGARLVAIPEGRFTRNGNNVQLGLSADEVSRLPEVKEQS